MSEIIPFWLSNLDSSSSISKLVWINYFYSNTDYAFWLQRSLNMSNLILPVRLWVDSWLGRVLVDVCRVVSIERSRSFWRKRRCRSRRFRLFWRLRRKRRVIVGGADDRRLVQTIRLAATESGSSESFSLKKTFHRNSFYIIVIQHGVFVVSQFSWVNERYYCFCLIVNSNPPKEN